LFGGFAVPFSSKKTASIMKKLVLAFMATCLLAGASFAQTPKKKDAKTKAAATATASPTATPAATAKAAKPAATAVTPTKKDGTADMRYKTNKEAAKTQAPAGPTKKDGTPDKRFKANKTAPAKS
jgi:hypothetical protein